jgi:ribonucleoside-diphosphate reductase alpha chain
MRPAISDEVWTQNYRGPDEITLQDTWERQARACASVEDPSVRDQVYHQFKWLLDDFKGIAGGRITANLGIDGRAATTLMNCFLPGTKVLTNKGYIPIEDISIGDVVLTHRGNWKTVHNILCREYAGNIDVYQSSFLNNTLSTTPEHKFYQGDERWKESSENDTLTFPKISFGKEYVTVDVSVFAGPEMLRDENYVWYFKESFGGNGCIVSKPCEKVNRHIVVDEDFAYVLGRFIGDGSVFKTLKTHFTNTAMNIVFSSKEEGAMYKCQQILTDKFGPTFNVNKGVTYHYIRKHNIVVAAFLTAMCGFGFDGKHVPSVIFESPKSVVKSFLLGLLDADGMVTKNGIIKITLSNEGLIDSIKSLMNAIGLFPRKTIAHNKHVTNASPAWMLSVSLSNGQTLFGQMLKVYDDDRLMRKFSVGKPFTKMVEDGSVITHDFVKHTEDYSGPVYNISVDTDESYVVEGVVVHNCYVHNPSDINYQDSDSIEGIYDMLKAQAHTLKSEGGYGMNFSWIRPAGSYVKGIGGRTPGVLKFMELWDKSSEIITMGYEDPIGNKKKEEKKKIRKGAQMGVLNIWHPEIEAFIDAKLVPGRLTKFNLSVGVTQGFMQAVKNDETWNLVFPDIEHPEYKTKWFGNLRDWESQGFPVIIHKTVRARDLWEKIMKATYTRNDPGVLFLDIANKYNPLYYAEEIMTTNPCGEIGMSTGVCLLFSLNLVKYIQKKEGKYTFDFDTFKKAVSIATRFADNINDISRVPLVEYKKSMLEKRRIGLGVLGLGSLFYILGIRYGSDESLKLTEEIFKAKLETELLTSAKLGQEKGSFTLFDKEEYFSSYWWLTLPISEDVRQQIESMGCMRNSHRAANAPTGNMSIYAGVVSGGIEPVFLKYYIRWSIVPEGDRAELRKAGFEFPDVNKGEWFETANVKLSKRGTDEVLLGSFNGVNYQVDKNRGLTKETLVEDYGWAFVKTEMSAEDIDAREKAGVFATTEDLTAEEHVKVLKVLARYVDMNSSKTVNVPADYPYDSFKNLYMEAWEAGIKGITTYRAGTMTAVLEKVTEDKSEASGRPTKIQHSQAPKRPKDLECEIHQPKINGKKWTILVGLLHGQPYEVFAGPAENVSIPKNITTGTLRRKGKGNYTLIVGEEEIKDIVETFSDHDSAWATRMISMPLRHGVPLEFVCEVLSKDGFITDVNKVLARILKKYMTIDITNKTCPACGSSKVNLAESCLVCLECGHGKCG